MLANYTWSKALDDDRTPLDTYNPRAEKSYSSFPYSQSGEDRRGLELPYGHDRAFGTHSPAIVNALAGDWDFSTIVNLQSGLPIGISRPSFQLPGTDARLSQPTAAMWFNTAVFVPAQAFTFGNVGPYLRDVTTQSIHNVDAALQKNFTMVPGEHHVTGTFRAETL